MSPAPEQSLRAPERPADGPSAAPVFTLTEMRRACVRAFLSGQSHRDDDRLPEYPPPDEIDRLITETLQERKDPS